MSVVLQNVALASDVLESVGQESAARENVALESAAGSRSVGDSAIQIAFDQSCFVTGGGSSSRHAPWHQLWKKTRRELRTQIGRAHV